MFASGASRRVGRLIGAPLAAAVLCALAGLCRAADQPSAAPAVPPAPVERAAKGVEQGVAKAVEATERGLAKAEAGIAKAGKAVGEGAERAAGATTGFFERMGRTIRGWFGGK